MEKKFLAWGLIFGVIAVIIGALGAHALKPHLSLTQQSSFETGIRYQMYHSLLLIIIAKYSKIATKPILYLLVSGVFLFSLSIYLLNLRELLNMNFLVAVGPITPIGGLLLISGWLLLIKNVFKASL